MQIERGADSHCNAIDARNNRLFGARQRDQEVPHLGAAGAAGGDGQEVGEIVARGKRAGHAEEDMATYGGIGVAFGLSQVRTSYSTAAKLERASGLPVIGSITEVVTPERHIDRRKKLVWLAGGTGALIGLYALLLAAEFIQRGLVA